MPPEIHIGDCIEFDVTIVDQNGNIIDLSNATTLNMIFEAPDQSTRVVTPTFLTNGKDGALKYLSLTTDLAIPGYWRYQAYVVVNGNSYRSDITRFRVYVNLPM